MKICHFGTIIINLLKHLTIAVVAFRATLIFADERICLNGAKINGKSVKLAFDSGANFNALSPQAVKRLGIKVDAAPTNDLPQGLVAGVTDHCTLTLPGIQEQSYFMVFNFPTYVRVDFDGFLGWYPSQNVVQIDAAARKVDFFSKVPRRTDIWTRFPVNTNFGTLELEVPHNDRANGMISIDTGSDGGLDLPPSEWHRWKDAHPNSPTTLRTFYTPSSGFVIREEGWADRVCIGSLVLNGVPISELTPADAARWGNKGEGTLGLAALKRVNLIVDGKNFIAYLQPKNTHPPAYPHNRLGAVFVPAPAHTNEFVAMVVSGSPADEAGVRTGDILLQVDEISVVGWTDDWRSRFEKPPRTKLLLTLRRDAKDFKTTATLRQIIGPNTDKKNP